MEQNPSEQEKIRALEQKLSSLEQEVALLRPQVEKVHRNIASSLMALMDMQNPQLSGHCKRVAGWSRELGAACGLPSPQLDEIELAGLLHDVGLLALPAQKLLKTGALRAFEEKMIRHPGIGYSLISHAEGLERAAEAILHHHERYDGGGFPHKLWGDRIPLYARILAVADSYDLELYMQSGGFAGADPEEARRLLVKERNHALDPDLVGKFLALITSAGVVTSLNAREIGISPGALRPGMVLSRDLRSVEKVLMLKAGTLLTDEIIDRLFSSDKSDWLVALVYVDAASIRDADMPLDARRDDKARLLDARPLSSAPAARRPEILVVDDSVAVCSALRRELGLSGMNVTGANTYPAALEELKKSRFDAVMTDLVISGSSGFEVLRAIRKHYPGLHCVVLSGFPTADNIRALREFDNVVRFVTKPWAQDVLLAALREAVDRGQNRPG